MWTPSEMYSLDVKIHVHEQNFLHLLSVNLPTENSQPPGFSDLKKLRFATIMDFADEDMSTLHQMINAKIDQEMKSAITEIKKHIDEQVNLAVVKIEASFSAAMKALVGNMGTVSSNVQDIKADVGKIM